PEVLVALCLERSPEWIAASLAVLAAGGAYLSLDPASPVERLLGMLEDSGAGLLLTRQGLAEGLGLEPAGSGAPGVPRVVCLDLPIEPADPCDNAFAPADPDRKST